MSNRVLVLLGLAVACAKSYAQTVSSTNVSFANTSALVNLAPGGTATVGFVIRPSAADLAPAVLVRAVGPSLSAFGITNPAPLPHLRVFNAQGQDVTVSNTVSLTPVDWSATFALAGAFPLTGGERPIYSFDNPTVFYGSSYTVQVTDDSGKGGTVLIEVYSVPVILHVVGGPT